MPCMFYMTEWDWNWWSWYEYVHESWLVDWLDIGMRLLCLINLWLVG